MHEPYAQPPTKVCLIEFLVPHSISVLCTIEKIHGLLQEEVLDQASLAMKKGMRRVNRALQQSKSNHFMYLAVFCLAIFFALYLWARVYRFVKKIG